MHSVYTIRQAAWIGVQQYETMQDALAESRIRAAAFLKRMEARGLSFPDRE